MSPQSGSPPGERFRPAAGPGGIDEQIAGGGSTGSIDETPHIPVFRPWSGRADAHTVELRFRRDRAGWIRRVDCARRLSYDAVDEVAPSGSWNSLEEIGADR
jgi:hypothetical protein